jgi:Protein of unknown function (DUF2934)
MSTFRVSSGQRRQMIAEAAYFRAERRGFDGADPVQDWIEAEVEVDAELRRLAREHIVERFEIALATATKQLAAFKKKLTDVAGEARVEWQQDLDKLAKLRDTLRQKVVVLREEGEEAGQKAKEQAEKVWDEISRIVERVGERVHH